MSTEEFDYYLPEELIAQTPLKDRSSSRLMTLNRETGEISNKHFTDIIYHENVIADCRRIACSAGTRSYDHCDLRNHAGCKCLFCI